MLLILCVRRASGGGSQCIEVTGMTGPLWVVFRAQNYCFGCLFGNPIIFMGLFLGPLFLWVCFWAGIIFLGQIFIRMTFFCLLKLKFHYFYGYLFGQNYFYGSFFARQIIFFGTGKISGAGHPRHFGILTTPPRAYESLDYIMQRIYTCVKVMKRCAWSMK